jgi:hypothetical protein
MSARRRSAGRLTAFLAALLLVTACQANDPAAATPRDAQGLLEELGRHGVTAVEQRGGDTGCADTSLEPNAVHWQLIVGGDPTPRDVYLFRFKDRATFTAGAAAVDACRAAFAARADRAGGELEHLEISPWRVFGDGWSAGLQDALRASLILAAGNGGDAAQ